MARLSRLLVSACAVALCESACSPEAVRTPTVPTSGPAVVTALSISGLPSDLVTGTRVQLTATATLSDGSNRDVTTTAEWRVSNAQVASISSTGILAIANPGETEVTAAIEGATASRRLTARATAPVYTISGEVHETAPTTSMRVGGVRIEVIGGPLDGRTFMTDSGGTFQLPPVPDSRFALKFKRSGYDDSHYDVVQLPRDSEPRIAMTPSLAVTRLELDTRLTQDDCPGEQSWNCYRKIPIPVHHRSSFNIYECEIQAFDGYTLQLWRGGQFITAVACQPPISLTVPIVWPTEPGFVYDVFIVGDIGGHYRVVLTHPS
jgi:hypothetical protein